MNKPKIVCLCGSTRFRKEFEKANFEETLKGNIVVSVGCFMHHDSVVVTKEEKRKLDELHLRKIDLADEIFFLNVDGYMGESTKNEFIYAMQKKKNIRFLEPQHYHENKNGCQ